MSGLCRTVLNVLLAYLDESYDKRLYWMAAVVCPDTEALALSTALDAVVEKAALAYGVGSRAELHGYDLFHAKHEWAPLTGMARARIGVYAEALDVIAAHDVRIYIRGVSIPHLEQRYVYPDHPHAVVLSHLIERVDEHADAQQEYTLLIADEVDGADDHRRNLWHFQRYSTGGWRARKICRVVDTIHFAPSNASRLLQAADLVAFLQYRIASGADTDARAIKANEALWARIDPKVRHRWCWTP